MRARTTWLRSILAVAGMSACSAHGGQTGGDTTRAATDGEGGLLARLCRSAECAGRFAHMTLWRDDQGALARVVFDGDIDQCSHPPRTYFDSRGKETLGIPFEPVEPGSPKALEYERSQAEQVAGLTKDRELLCRDVGAP